MDSTEKLVPLWQAASAAAILSGCCSNMSLACTSPVMATPPKPRIATTRADPQRPDPDAVVLAVAARHLRGLADDDATVLIHRVDAVPPALPQLVPGDAEQEAAGDREGAHDGVRERDDRGVVGQHGPDVVHDRPPVDQFDADRMLHPRVRDDDEVRGDDRRRSPRPRGSPRCSFFGRRSQPKIHRPRKVDSTKKASSALHGQRRAEDVADEAASTRSTPSRTGTPARCRWRHP